MPADRTYRIRVETRGDPSGAKSVGDALDKTTESTEGASRATEKHSAGLHAMHRLFHALNEVVPGLGVAMQAAFSPIGATISLAVMGLQLFREHAKKVNEELDKMAEENARPLTNRLEAMRETVVLNATGMAALRDRLAEAARQQQVLAHETERAVEASKQQAAEVQALRDVHKEDDLTLLEDMHKAGLLSEEQYAAQKLAIEQRYLEAKRAAEEQAAVRENQALRLSIERAKGQEPGLKDTAEEAEKRKTKALEDLNALRPKGEIDEDKKKSAAALKAFEEKYTEWSRWFADFGVTAKPSDVSATISKREDMSAWEASGGFGGMTGGAGLSEEYAEWVKLKTAADAAEKAWKQAPGEEAKRKVAADSATRADEEAAKQLLENAAYVREKTRQHDDRRDQLEAQHEANEERNRAEREANRLKGPLGQFAVDQTGKAAATAEQEKAGHRQSPEAEHQLIDVATRIAGHKTSLAEAVKLMDRAAHDAQVFSEDATKLATVTENFARTLATFKSYHLRLDALEQAMADFLKAHPGA